jgi:hypothetical protein
MEMLYQLSYNGTMSVLRPVTCSGTEQVVFGVRKTDSWLRLAIFSDVEENLFITIDFG